MAPAGPAPTEKKRKLSFKERREYEQFSSDIEACKVIRALEEATSLPKSKKK